MSEQGASAYDAAADSFSQHRELPDGVPEAIRSAVWAVAGGPDSRRVLDLGAGTGRVGLAFVAAGDRYAGVDASLAMLATFAQQQRALGRTSVALAQAEGEALPFADGTFDVVLMMQVLSEGRVRRRLLVDAQRVLCPSGKLVVGRTAKPKDGMDARLKQQLDVVLSNLGVPEDESRGQQRADAMSRLEATATASMHVDATSWVSRRTPRRFIERHQTGHRFSQLPAAVRAAAVEDLSRWAAETFGSLDAEFPETYRFGLQVFTF